MKLKLKKIFKTIFGKIFAPKAVFGVVLGVVVISNLSILLIPRAVNGAKGDTEYGKWYTADEIVLKSVIRTAGPDGVFKDTPYIRTGLDSGVVKVHLKLYLEKPEQLTFAQDEATNFNQDARDGVKGPEKYLNNFMGERIYPLVGFGVSYGVGAVKSDGKSLVECGIKKLNWFWQSQSAIPVCKDPKYGKDFDNDKMNVVAKVGDEVFNKPFEFSATDINNFGFNKPGTVYALEIWPSLRVNTGDLSMTEAVVATGVSVGASQALKKLAEALPGAASKAGDILNKTKDKAKALAETGSHLLSRGISEAEAKIAAGAIVNGVENLGKTTGGNLNIKLIEDTAEIILKELTGKGMALEKAMSVSDEVIATAISSANKVAGSAGQVSKLTEPAVRSASLRIAQKVAVKSGIATEAVAKSTGLLVGKFIGKKIIPFVGWAWTVADIALYYETFNKDSLPYYPGNMHKIFIHVYATEKEAIAEKDLPPAEEVASEVANASGGRTGSAKGPEGGLSGISQIINNVFVYIASLVTNGIYWVFGTLVSPMMEGILSIRVYTDAFVNVIYPGWEVLRNVVNIYFIVAIIAIAMATLFRVESYKVRPLLIQLIIAALTVNFSLVISQAILGVADTIQNQFLPNNSAVIKQLAGDLMPVKIKDIVEKNQLVANSVFGTAITSLFLMSMALGSFVVFCAVLIFLGIRIIMLWILLMVSPVAYAAGVLPSTSNLRGQWWGEFLKYAFFTPVMAFFLNMAAIIAVNHEYIYGSITISSNVAGGGQYSTLVLAVASNVLILLFLFAGVNFAQKAGVFGADTVDKVFKTGVFAPWVGAGAVGALGAKGGKKLVGFGAEKFHEKTGIEIRPKEWLEGWKHSREENKLKRRALGQAKALARGSPLGNPTSFFQRYWNIPTIKRLVKGGDRKGRRLISEAGKVKSDYLKKKNEFDIESRNPAPDQAKLQRLKEEMEELKHHYRHLYHEGHLLLAPVDYHTQKEFRGNVDQEKNKIHTKNWHELWDLFQTARHEKEAIRATAIFKKVTETYNENEFINNAKYTRDLKAIDSSEWNQILAKAKREKKSQAEISTLGEQILHKEGEFFTMSADGAENFRKLILEEELGLGEQISMQVMSDVSDTAEDKNHRVIMRMYGSKDGKLYYKPANEREPEVRAENNKLNAESFLNGCNRLAGFAEVPDEDYDISESRKSVVTAPMLAYYLEHYSDVDPLVRRGRINTSQAKAVAENYDIFVRAAEIFNDDIDEATGQLKLYEDLNVTIPIPPAILGQGDDAVMKYKLASGGYKTKKALYLQGVLKVKEKGLSLTSDSEGKSTIDKAIEYLHK